jgi:5-(carboxyamino)imidazole ribonucleotide synthase
VPEAPADLPRAAAVGIVGAGQLARMTCEAASALGFRTVVLAESPGDSAAQTAHEVVLGSPDDPVAMRALAEHCDVVTFDHEQVDLHILSALEAEGVTVRPGVKTLEMAVDKSVMRRRLEVAGVPVPPYEVIDRAAAADPRATTAAIVAFAGREGWPVVVKAARGGYDGKGVWPVEDAEATLAVCERAAATRTQLLVESFVAVDAELAVVVARNGGGDAVSWPPVETAQVEGVCREVLFPGLLAPEVARRAASIARRVAEVAESVGVLAVELFLAGGRLLVNEVAARPHNSAHWTIEGSTTSQFENHLRAVLDLPLGATDPIASHVASVNVFGGAGSGPSRRPGGDTGAEGTRGLRAALAVPGAHVHLYGKQPRPGRKLGHVTVCGGNADEVRDRAWAAARALGTPVPAAIGLPGSATGRPGPSMPVTPATPREPAREGAS